MQKIAFFFTENDLKLLQVRKDFANIKLIAVTPEADFAAENASVPYKTIEDYYDEKALNERGNQDFEHIKSLCEFLDQQFFPKHKDFSTVDLFMQIKFIYDQLLIGSAVMTGILTKEEPTFILLPKLLSIEKDLWTENNNDLLTQIMIHYARINNIIYEEYNKLDALSIPVKASHNFIKEGLSKIKWKIQQFYSNLVKKKGIASIFIIQPWDFQTCKNLRFFFKVYWLKDLNLDEKIHKDEETLPGKLEVSLGELESFFQFDRICLLDLVKPKLEFLITTVAPKITRACKFFEQYYQNKKIDMIISAAGQSLTMIAALRAAKNLNIPIVWGQHGGLYGYGDFPLHKYISFNYTHYFLYTPAIQAIDLRLPHYVVSDTKLLNLYKKRYEN